MVSDKALMVFTAKATKTDNGYFIRLPKKDGDTYNLKDKRIRVEIYELDEEITLKNNK